MGLMSDTHARVTAMVWHEGQHSALYSFGSSGAIPVNANTLLGEIAQAHSEADSRASLAALESLAAYVGVTPSRGPQPAWAAAWDQAFERSL
jgi:hypothetical protein